MLDIILNMINAREDAPIQVIPGYSNEDQPPKPFGCAYLIDHRCPDEYSNDFESEDENEVREKMSYWGEFLIQFDVFGNTELEAFRNAIALRKLITYKMRYQDWLPNEIGIVNPEYSLNPLHEKADTGEYIYRYSFDVTFESRLSMERVTEIAKTIELAANPKEIVELKPVFYPGALPLNKKITKKGYYTIGGK